MIMGHVIMTPPLALAPLRATNVGDPSFRGRFGVQWVSCDMEHRGKGRRSQQGFR